MPALSLPVSLNDPIRPYFGAEHSTELHSGHTHILGFGFDGTACFRKGTKEGPDGLRSVSEDIESYSPYLDADLEDHTFYDLGNLRLGFDDDEEQQWHHALSDFNQIFDNVDLAKENIKLLTLGGEHSISYAPIVKYLKQYPDLVLLHLDAHADLRDGFLGYHYSHASIIRRSVDHFGPGHELIQYGIRSGTRDEYQWMKEHKTIRKSRQEFLESVEAIAADRLTELLPSTMLALSARLYSELQIAQRYQPVFNLPITNVPGPQVPLYLQGSRLVRQFNSAPLFDSMGLVIVAVSYQGSLTINFTLCPDVVADGDSLPELLENSLKSIESAAETLPPYEEDTREYPDSHPTLTDEALNAMEGALRKTFRRFRN